MGFLLCLSVLLFSNRIQVLHEWEARIPPGMLCVQTLNVTTPTFTHWLVDS